MMQFRDDTAPTVTTTPGAGSSLMKLLVPAGAGFAIGGPIGAAVGLGAGYFLSKGGAAPAPKSASIISTDARVPDIRPLTPEEQAQIAAGAGRPAVEEVLSAEMAKAAAAKLVSLGLAAGVAVLHAGGSVAAAISAGAEAVKDAAAAAGPAIIIIADVAGIALAVANILGYDPLGFKPMWDALSPEQQKMYMDCVNQPGGCVNQVELIKAGVMGAGTGQKQIVNAEGDYVLVGGAGVVAGALPPSVAAKRNVPVVENGTVIRGWIYITGVGWGCPSGSACSDPPLLEEGDPITQTGTRPQSRYMLGDGSFGSYSDYFGDLTYVVQDGDTLTGIALVHGLCAGPTRMNPLDWSDCLAAANRIAQANGITDPDLIVTGQQLIIPDVTAQVVQTAAGPVVVPVAKKSYAVPMILGLGILGAFLMLGKH